MYTYTHTITFTYTQPSLISMSLILQDKQLNSKPYNNPPKIIKSNHIVHLLNNFVLLNWLIFGLCLISWLRLSLNDVIQGLWVFLPLVFISLSRSLASSIRSSHCVLRMRGLISMSQTRKRHLMGAEEVCSAASSLSAASSPRCGVQWSMFSLRFGWGVFWDDSNLEVFLQRMGKVSVTPPFFCRTNGDFTVHLDFRIQRAPDTDFVAYMHMCCSSWVWASAF